MPTENLLFTNDLHNFQMINNYIYMYHLNKFIILPAYAEDISDTSDVNFTSSNPLARSAPIFSYAGSGPRVVTVRFSFHREMMKQINYNNSSVITDDYVDELIKDIQACTLPVYSATSKMVNPPIVALRMGEDVFIKGVIGGSLGLTYKTPILSNGKYAVVDFTITIKEVDPYDAETITKIGSYRAAYTGNLSSTLERGYYGYGSPTASNNSNSSKNSTTSTIIRGGGWGTNNLQTK